MAGLTAARSVLMVHSLQAMQQPEIHHHTCVALWRMPAASLAELRSQFVSSSSNLLLRHCVQASRKRGFFVAAAAADIGEEEFDGEEVAGLLEHPVDSVDEAGASKEDSLREEQKENEGEDVEDLKKGFFNSLYGTQYGLRASSDTRAEVIELITQLEGLKPLRAQHINANLKVEEDVVEGVVIDRSDRLGRIVDVNAVAIRELCGNANQKLGRFVEENARELTIASIVFGLVCMPDSNALAFGPEGPLVEEFWDNVRRYGFYFFTVVTGGLYSLTKPIVDLVKQPSTQILVVIALVGTFYLLYLTVSTMLGLTEFDYQYAQ